MKKFILGIVVLAMLVAFSTPASATCPCVTIDTDTINGSIYYKSYNSWPGAAAGGGHTATHTFTGVPAGVKIARVHAGVWDMGSGSVEITVNGNASGPRAAGACNCNAINDPDLHDYCTGSGAHFITYEATDDIPTDGGDVTVTLASTSAKDGRLYVIALLVVYENASMANMTYWVNEGACYIESGPCSVYFNGAYESGVNDVTYWTIGVPHGISTHPSLNGNPIGNPDHHEGGSYYDFWRWDGIDTDWLNPSSNLMYYTGSGYQRVGGAVLKLWREPPELPDLVVTEIDAGTPRPNQAFTVTATIKNVGSAAAGASTATLYVDDVSNGSAGVLALAIGDSETVSFTGVNLPEGCYDFKVVADSAGVIGESDETNNASNEDYQVGNVIVVRSNSDFADIETEGLAREDGGTYYIEDLTITNCAGDGIFIENTTVPFVIDNCTITNCKNSGVFVNNATDGTITECTLQNNEVYGVELGIVPLDSTDPERINITCNTIYQNGVNGIDLIGADCTVTCNTIRDNTMYGIYVFGNDNKLCNNTIEGNDDYGVKLYNSSGNYIFWNNFTDNNGVGVQGYDNRVTNDWNEVSENYPYGAVYTNYTGNYWDDHTAPDADGDGVVDTAYPLDGSAGAEDSYPLVTMPWTFDIPIYNGLNAISIPLYQDDPTLDGVFGDIAVNGDVVRRYVNSEEKYHSAEYFDGYGWHEYEVVEPIEPGVGCEYERVGANCTLVVNGTRLCLSTVETPIYNGMNLIGYLNFTPTDLSTFNSPVNGDVVRRYVNSEEKYHSAEYFDGYGWHEYEVVEPIEVGVGYYYERAGPDYVWTYEV